jgi:hypothetical protein
MSEYSFPPFSLAFFYKRRHALAEIRLNDAERLFQDPTFLLIGSEKIWDRSVALTSWMQSFETAILAEVANFTGLASLSRALIANAEALDSGCRTVLDMDSTEIPVYGAQEQSAYKGHFESSCRRPTFTVVQISGADQFRSVPFLVLVSLNTRLSKSTCDHLRVACPMSWAKCFGIQQKTVPRMGRLCYVFILKHLSTIRRDDRRKWQQVLTVCNCKIYVHYQATKSNKIIFKIIVAL